MKRFLMTFLAVCVMVSTAYAQTRDIVPRADGEGGIGTASKAWLDVYAKTVTAATAYKFPEYTVSGLPSASPAGKVVSVTDGNGGCSTGSGSDRILCQSNGSSWVAVATVSGGSGDVTGVFSCSTGDCQSIAVQTGDTFRIEDNVNVLLGTNDDWTLQYDETTNDSLLLQTAKTVAGAAGTPMFRVLVDNANSGMTANAVVFAIQKGLVSSPTNIFSVDEDGDTTFAGSINAGGSGSSITFSSGAQLQDSANSTILLGATTTLDVSSQGTLIIENGTNATVDSAGKIGIDSTEGQFLFHDGSGQHVVSGRKGIDLVIPLPTDSMSFLFKKAKYDMTITGINGIVDPSDTGESVVFDIRECNSTGDSCVTVDATITADNDGAADDGSLSNPTIDADDWMLVDIGTVTSGGTLDNLTISIDFVEDRK